MPGIRPVLVGDGPQTSLAAAPGCPTPSSPVPLETGDLTRAMAALDVLVHPGTEETCCHALREAAASGVPVVAPRAGGAPDVVRSLESGLLYEPSEPHGLARAVARSRATGTGALLGARGRELAVAATGGSPSTSCVDLHYGALVGRRRARRTRPDLRCDRPVTGAISHSPWSGAANRSGSVLSVATTSPRPTLVKGARGARSTIALKLLMAVSGIVFILFVLVHMYGNLKAFAGHDAYNEYAEHLREIGEPMLPHEGLLWIIRVGLIVSLVVHVYCAVTLWRRAGRARTVKYHGEEEPRLDVLLALHALGRRDDPALPRLAPAELHRSARST